MKEIWKQIYGYPDYKVSNYGRVWGRRYNKVLKPQIDRYGYLYVNLYKDGKLKSVKIHRLVAAHFIAFVPEEGKTLNDYQVNHIDENKEHNYSSNLNYTDCKGNINHGTANTRRGQTMSGEKHPMYGRPRIGKTILCIETGKIYHSTREAAADVGVASTGIVKCCNGKRNICAGYHWRYLD